MMPPKEAFPEGEGDSTTQPAIQPPDIIDPRDEQVDDEVEASRAPIMEHLIELRSRIIYVVAGMGVAFLVGLYFADTIFQFLARPYADAQINGAEARMIFTGLMEKFVVNIKVALYFAFMLTFPLLAVQVWKFVAPGLYKHERGAFAPFLVATPILFTLGAALAYYVVIPWAWQFLLSFEEVSIEGTAIAIEAEAKVNEYLALVMRLIFAFGAAFLIPVAITLLGKAGIVSADFLRRQRRYMVVITFVAAAFLTPPDPVSQVALGIPILLLYELSIILVRLTEKRREAAEAASDDMSE